MPSRRHKGAHSIYYAKMEGPFRACGASSEGKLCDAHVIVLDARLAGDCVYAQLQKEPLFFTKEYQERQNG